MMTRNRIRSLWLGLVVMAAALPLGCGGSSDGGSGYQGSNDPAVLDSTVSIPIAQEGVHATQQGIPLGKAFLLEPVASPEALAARPATAMVNTHLAITLTQLRAQDPNAGILQGSMFAPGGTGSLTLDGTLTLLVGAISAQAATWDVISGVFDGTIAFEHFRAEDSGATLSGRVNVADGVFTFSNSVQYLVGTGFSGDPGLPMWQTASLTFAELDLDRGGTASSLLDGGWELTTLVGLPTRLKVIVSSMVVVQGGATYKVEDAELTFGEDADGVGAFVWMNMGCPSASDLNGARFFHPDYGYCYASINIREYEGSDRVYGTMSLGGGASDFARILVDWDTANSKNAYNLDIYDAGGAVWDFVDRGFVTDWVFTSDPEASDIHPTP